MDRETLVDLAKLAEQAERFHEMADSMKKVVTLDVELTPEERDLFFGGYKYLLSSRREVLRILSSLHNRNAPCLLSYNAKSMEEYRHKMESELSGICSDMMAVIDEYLIPSCNTGESTVFYYQMKGDCYRYLAEFKTGNDMKEAVDRSLKAYLIASTTAETDLPPSHPTRLGLAVNFSKFYYEIMNSPERACHLAKTAIDEAIAELDTWSDNSSFIQLLRNNLTVWTSDIPEDEDQKMETSGKTGGGEDKEICHLLLMDSSNRETFVFIAKITQQAKHYDEMAELMKKVATLDVELTEEERNLLFIGYKAAVGSQRAWWRLLSSLGEKEKSIGNQKKWVKWGPMKKDNAKRIKRIKAYMLKER